MERKTSLLGPSKYLRHTDDHFQGYWVQLQSLIRRDDDADELLDGFLINPILRLRQVTDRWELRAEPERKDSSYKLFEIAMSIKTLYVAAGLGTPPDYFPPSKEELEQDPMKHIKNWNVATMRGTAGGTHPDGRTHVQARTWVRKSHEIILRYRKATKFIWETAVGTLTTANATTIIAGLPYGSGVRLLRQIENQQQRQTTMALFTLFSKLITLQLKPGEKLRSLYARALAIRTRLLNWKPPVTLPDKLIIVCLLRLLPGKYASTRLIIMSSSAMNLKKCQDMLLDVENGDAERVAKSLGSQPVRETPKVATGLVSSTTNLPKGDMSQKSEKYITEGPCPVHGTMCSHAASECITLHPELREAYEKKKAEEKKRRKKKKKQGSANVVTAKTVVRPQKIKDLNFLRVFVVDLQQPCQTCGVRPLQ